MQVREFLILKGIVVLIIVTVVFFLEDVDFPVILVEQQKHQVSIQGDPLHQLFAEFLDGFEYGLQFQKALVDALEHLLFVAAIIGTHADQGELAVGGTHP